MTSALPAAATAATDHSILQLSQRLDKLTNEVAHLRSQLVTNKPVRNSAYRAAFDLAATDPATSCEKLYALTHPVGPHAVVDTAKLALTGPVGRPTDRRALRLVAVLLLRRVLATHPNHVDALCALGESFLPTIFFGHLDVLPPRSVLDESYRLFDRAANRGSSLGLFLKGRWLVTLEPVHRNPQQVALGRQCIKAAVEQNNPRALVFLAHRYEYPELDKTASFSADLPRGKAAREKIILDLYMRAADQGDPDALNDIGTSYAEGYASLKLDFDTAADYYKRAINRGSLQAFDNLGTHYETGMGGRSPDRVDFQKALYYYRLGACRRCPKCAYNLGAAYEEGMSGALQRDTARAEKYYRLSIIYADAQNDVNSATRSLKELYSLYVTRIKLNHPDSDVVATSKRRLYRWSPGEQHINTVVMPKLNRAIVAASKGRTNTLRKMLGDMNTKLIVTHVRELEARIKDDPNPDDIIMLNHAIGQSSGSGELGANEGSLRRKRSGNGTFRPKKRRRAKNV